MPKFLPCPRLVTYPCLLLKRWQHSLSMKSLNTGQSITLWTWHLAYYQGEGWLWSEDEAFVTRTLLSIWHLELRSCTSDQLDMSSVASSPIVFQHQCPLLFRCQKCQGSNTIMKAIKFRYLYVMCKKSFPGDNYCPQHSGAKDCDEVEGLFVCTAAVAYFSSQVGSVRPQSDLL
jgi:hypothetical protein